MEEGLASLGLSRVAELRSEMRALRGGIELQLNERVMLLDAANDERAEGRHSGPVAQALTLRRAGMSWELLTSLRGRQRHMDAISLDTPTRTTSPGPSRAARAGGSPPAVFL